MVLYDNSPNSGVLLLPGPIARVKTKTQGKLPSVTGGAHRAERACSKEKRAESDLSAPML